GWLLWQVADVVYVPEGYHCLPERLCVVRRAAYRGHLLPGANSDAAGPGRGLGSNRGSAGVRDRIAAPAFGAFRNDLRDDRGPSLYRLLADPEQEPPCRGMVLVFRLDLLPGRL